MLEFALTIIGFAAAISIPGFLAAIVESAAFKLAPSPALAGQLYTADGG